MSSPHTALTGKQAAHLRALAHSLKPIVQVGKNGWSAGLRQEIDGALLAHELIKIKLGRETPVDAGAIAVHVEAENLAAVVQIIDNILVVYRRHPERPKIELPKPGRRRPAPSSE